MEKGLQVAVRLFPLQSQEIRRLAFASSIFRSLCDDLAEAETALEQLTGPASAQHDLRRTEYQVLIEELSVEIGNMLKAHAR